MIDGTVLEPVAEASILGMVDLYESGTGMTYVVSEKTYDSVELKPEGLGTTVMLIWSDVVVAFDCDEVLLLNGMVLVEDVEPL